MTRKRDLSGFGIAPAARPPVDVAPRHEPRTEVAAEPKKRSNGGTRPKARSKKRITLSLPTRVAAQLRETAEKERRIYLDIILRAFVDHADAVEAELIAGRAEAGLTPRGSRRRADSGRTQIPLNILGEDLRVIDARSAAIGLDRSAYVTELLTRAIG
ncbi:MAG: hypothetical protein OEO77_12220 [Acidimicrobiia bacterium]|nr:hypothetical protein [Acidimicrobiia bacterium]